MYTILIPALTALPLLTALPALAASSPWFETEGGNIRLLVDGLPDEEGRLLGAIEIDLRPGWKTYWRDPGGAGVPLQMDLSRSTNVAEHKIGYPAPRRFDDGYSAYAGYDHPVALAVTFTVPDPAKPVTIDADIFLGICETICIPVQTRFQLAAAQESTSTPDTAIVAMAHANVPQPAAESLRIANLVMQDDMLMAHAETKHSGKADLYVINSDGWYFGTPVAFETNDGHLEFRIPVLERPAGSPDTAALLEYTLVVGETAVDGRIPLP